MPRECKAYVTHSRKNMLIHGMRQRLYIYIRYVYIYIYKFPIRQYVISEITVSSLNCVSVF